MKQLKSILTFVLAVVAISACRDNSLSPVPFDTVVSTNGGYIITVSTPSATYNFYDLAHSTYTVNVQVYDSRGGNEFQSVDIYASYKDNTPGNGTWNPAETKVMSIPASGFTKDATSGNPAASINIPAETAITAMGGTDANVSGSDVFNFRQVLVMKDGSTYTNTNTDINILAGAAYNAPFLGSCSVVCPSTLEGTYNVVQDGTDQVYGTTHHITGTITLTHTASGSVTYKVDDVSGGVFAQIYYPLPYGAPQYVPYTIGDACGSISIPSGSDGWGDILSGSASVTGGTDGGLVVSAGSLVIQGKWVTNSGDNWTFTWTHQ